MTQILIGVLVSAISFSAASGLASNDKDDRFVSGLFGIGLIMIKTMQKKEKQYMIDEFYMDLAADSYLMGVLLGLAAKC